MKRTLVISLLSMLMLASCTKRGATLASTPTDSLTLRVAVMPVMDCLPMFYAWHSGIFDSLGLQVQLHCYPSMMDVDTALVRRRADVGYTALPRLLQMAQRDSTELLPLIQCYGSYALALRPASKLKRVAQLNDKMIALARNNHADWWSDVLADSAALPRDAFFRPQVNDLALRLQMLTDTLVDAALLPHPHAIAAQHAGARIIMQSPDTLPSMHVFAAHRMDSLLLTGYNIAAHQLNTQPDSALLRRILREDMQQDDQLWQAIQWPKYPQATAPTTAWRDSTAAWAERRTLKP